MAEVIIRFTTCDRFVNRAIEWVTMSQVSHCEIEIPGEGWCGALPDGGTQIRPYDYNIGPRGRSILAGVDVDRPSEVYGFLRKQINKPYDYAALVGFLFERNWCDWAEKWYCSELTVAAIKQGGRPLFNCAAASKRGAITTGEIFVNPLLRFYDF
jgi:hypothetical protein